MSTPRGQAGASRGAVLGGLVLVVGVVLVVVLGSQAGTARPYDLRSTEPDGYAAFGELLERQGAEVRARSAAAVADAAAGPGDVVFVPVPQLASAAERAGFLDAARRGAVVVYGQPDLDDDLGLDGFGPAAGVFTVDGRTLAETPAAPVPAGRCDIEVLADLTEIDGAFATPVDTEGLPSCFGDGRQALVVREPLGEGALVTLGAPELLVNARLQPAKEDGGTPLDNAAMGLALFGPPPDGAGPGVVVSFVDPVAGAGATAEGGANPVDLLPLGVRLALVMGCAAFVLYAWARSRRLGPPVTERVPVEIAGSELVVAVGDLLRRTGTPGRAAQVLRDDTRRALSRRLGVPGSAPPAALVEVVADRTGRPAPDVAAVLLDAPVGAAVDGADALVRLSRSLDELRQEVLHEPVPG